MKVKNPNECCQKEMRTFWEVTLTLWKEGEKNMIFWNITKIEKVDMIGYAHCIDVGHLSQWHIGPTACVNLKKKKVLKKSCEY